VYCVPAPPARSIVNPPAAARFTFPNVPRRIPTRGIVFTWK
jgi:hypothetical protein